MSEHAGPCAGIPLTEELLDRLLASTSVEAYLGREPVSDCTLTDYLRMMMDGNGMRRADVVRASGLNATVVYDIFAGKSRPGRDRAIALAIGLNCDLRQTQRLLRLAGATELWCRHRRDAIIIWCIDNGLDRAAVDGELRRLGEATLPGATPDATSAIEAHSDDADAADGTAAAAASRR
ncbi:helix-turn-helix domain-containing protein [Bifidobacterium samirii]|uniref:Preprotein translocase subunit SecA n=1 Tax=Bifidobacterium samirii TaxID=2306974 RepID=A0A430FUW7_9BIFI|nr:helix-turn-helix transcriptional regulator [Bifidobacterium samirii]RSX57186.1 preprotein translocase subunit SecA [Bifidobacterium samirii]